VKYFKAICIFLLISLVIVGCQSEPEPDPENPETIPESIQFYAASSIHYRAMINKVVFRVEEAGFMAVPPDSNPNYAPVLVTLSVFNESNPDVGLNQLVLVDNHGNIYSEQYSPPDGNQQTGLPISVPTGESANGQIMFSVPIGALNDNLRLRWDSELHQARIEIFLGPLGERVD
jgi:hypothetical protein